MNPRLKYLLLFIIAFQAVSAVGYYVQAPLALDLWPWPGTTRLSYLFVSSIFAAAAASTLWCVVSRKTGALAGIALDYLLIFTPLMIFSFQVASSTQDSAIAIFGVACVVGVIFGLGLFWWSRRVPMEDSRPMPQLVRWSFVVFIIALLIVGVQMVLKVPNIIPWRVSEEVSVVIGWMYLGAAAYFAYGLLFPSWSNTGGQLAGFLAYDIVLIVPFIERLPTVEPEFARNHYIYTAVVIYSGLVAIYYLFINSSTRLWQARQMQPAV